MATFLFLNDKFVMFCVRKSRSIFDIPFMNSCLIFFSVMGHRGNILIGFLAIYVKF